MPPPQRRPKAKSCKENVLESISDRGLAWLASAVARAWAGPGLAWGQSRIVRLANLTICSPIVILTKKANRKVGVALKIK